MNKCRVCGAETRQVITPCLCKDCEQRMKFNTLTRRLAANIDAIQETIARQRTYLNNVL